MVLGVLILCEFVLGGEEAEEFSAGAVLEEEVEFLVVLKAELHLDEEWVFDLS